MHLAVRFCILGQPLFLALIYCLHPCLNMQIEYSHYIYLSTSTFFQKSGIQSRVAQKSFFPVISSTVHLYQSLQNVTSELFVPTDKVTNNHIHVTVNLWKASASFIFVSSTRCFMISPSLRL